MLLLSLHLLEINSLASTLPVFNSEEKTASVLIRGNQTGDLDARKLYDLLKVPVEVDQGYNVKSFVLEKIDLEIVCVMSPRYQETGTCRIRTHFI